MNATLSAAFDAQMQMGEVHVSAGRPEEAYACFERAHVLGQWHLKAHLRAHLGLLRVGWRSRDSREIWGQCLRLAAALVATPVGWLPAGNTGGARTSAWVTMPIDAEAFQLLLADARSARGLARLGRSS